MILLGVILAMVIAAGAAYYIWTRWHAPLLLAEHLVENQANRATKADIDFFRQVAQGLKREMAFDRDLAAIRMQVGPEGLCVGHLAWIAEKLLNKLPADSAPPDYSRGN